jgi:hypothetical protein
MVTISTGWSGWEYLENSQLNPLYLGLDLPVSGVGCVWLPRIGYHAGVALLNACSHIPFFSVESGLLFFFSLLILKKLLGSGSNWSAKVFLRLPPLNRMSDVAGMTCGSEGLFAVGLPHRGPLAPSLWLCLGH